MGNQGSGAAVEKMGPHERDTYCRPSSVLRELLMSPCRETIRVWDVKYSIFLFYFPTLGLVRLIMYIFFLSLLLFLGEKTYKA